MKGSPTLVKLYQTIKDLSRRALSQPGEQATRWHRALRFSVDLARYCARQLREDRAGEMAAALTYRTIFSLVPFFVLALIVFRAFGGFEAWGQDFQSRIYEYLGLSAVAVQQAEPDDNDEPFVTPSLERAERDARGPADPAAPPGELTEEEAVAQDATIDELREREQLRLTLEDVFARLNEQVSQVSFTSIGIVGIVLLIWAALALAVTVEDSFNQVYHATSSRPWHLRIAIYWSAITLGPVLLAMSLWMTGQVIGGLEGLLALGQDLPWLWYIMLNVGTWLLGLLGQLAAFLATWVLLFLLYVLMPNTTVHLRPALIGSMIAAALWEIAKYMLGLYVNNAVGYTALYGTLALIPLFLFWVYVTWLIVLFGLELTYTLQTLKGRRLKEIEQRKTEEHDPLIDPRWIIPMMTVAAAAFEHGRGVSLGELQERTGLSIRVLARLTQQLQQEGLLHQIQDTTANGDRCFALALPPDQIEINRLLDLGQLPAGIVQANRDVPGRDVLDRLNRAQQDAANHLTLASLVGHQPAR
ncbi:MAG: YihY/virulence factor BrkB family protein [Phycisphaeraceae bacterium]